MLIAILITSCGGAPQGSENTTENMEKAGDISINILHAGGAHDGIVLLNAQETFEEYYAMGYRYFEYDFKLSRIEELAFAKEVGADGIYINEVTAE